MELKALVKEDLLQTQEQAFLYRLKPLEMIQKQRNWIPSDLQPKKGSSVKNGVITINQRIGSTWTTKNIHEYKIILWEGQLAFVT